MQWPRKKKRYALPAAYVATLGYLAALLVWLWGSLQDADAALVLTMSLLSLTFCVLYATRSNWRATPQGRALMYLTAAFTSVIAVSATLSVLHRIDPVPGEYVIRFAVFGAFVMTEVHITYVLWTSQNQHRHRMRELERALADAMAREDARIAVARDNNLREFDHEEEAPS